MRPDRRTFMTTMLAAAAAPGILHSRARARYPLAFSTLGCPAWSWQTILRQADTLGYAGLELRGVAGEMDLTKVPELTGTRWTETRKDLAAIGVTVSDLGASAAMHLTGTAREAALDEGRRFIDLAHTMGVKYVRVFGDQIPPGEPREVVFARVAEGFRTLAAHAATAGVTVIMETHGDFTHAPDVTAIHQAVASKAFAILWDAHHTFVAGHEQPADTWKALGTWVKHCHLKDSLPAEKDRRYVLTGAGEVPVKAQVQVLASGGYQGFYCFEWEKKWHPEIEEPEVAFPHYARTMTEYLRAAGIKPA
ncbi:MAG TPA: sugar phosphate isomerase/epimerase family protein [Vicinamibacterales bacterium]|nr:sugar phosphate isomerase/epimerase family protein [Vicinamibacterales bacterium]